MIKLKGKQLIIIALVVVAAGAGWFFLKGDGGTGVGSLTQKFSQKSPFTGSLKAAVALGVPMKCTYKVDEMEYTGYIKGKQYKGKLTMPDGQEGSVLLKGTCVYTWSETDNQGVKICYEEEELDMWEQYAEESPLDYVCYPAVISDSEFNIPSGVSFMDMNNMMNNPGFDY